MGRLEDFIQPEGNMPGPVVITILLVFLFNIVALIYLMARDKKKDENKMQKEVQLHVDKYFKLQNSEPFDNMAV